MRAGSKVRAAPSPTPRRGAPVPTPLPGLRLATRRQAARSPGRGAAHFQRCAPRRQRRGRAPSRTATPRPRRDQHRSAASRPPTAAVHGDRRRQPVPPRQRPSLRAGRCAAPLPANPARAVPGVPRPAGHAPRRELGPDQPATRRSVRPRARPPRHGSGRTTRHSLPESRRPRASAERLETAASSPLAWAASELAALRSHPDPTTRWRRREDTAQRS